MDIEVESEDSRRMSFALGGARTGFANLIRRYAMSRVPTFAIDKVTMYENTSSAFDEYIAHRIGLVPLRAGASVREDDEALFTLEASGPCTVYSADLKAAHDKIRVATERIPLLNLMQEQNLRLEAKAIAGIGCKHAKWQAGLAGYEIDPKGSFNFKVESFMQMAPRDMLLKAADLVDAKCDEMEKQLEELKKAGKAKPREE